MQKLLARSPTGLGRYFLRTTKRRDLASVACGLIFSGMKQQVVFDGDSFYPCWVRACLQSRGCAYYKET